jgi:hypothetical protein
MIKRDIFDELIRDKKFLEMELAGLGQNSIISYKEKIEKMTETLKAIAVVNGSFGLLDAYIPDMKQAQRVEPKNEPDVVAESLSPVPEPEETQAKEVVVNESPFPKIAK